jgi:pimeloyl-ACP methyl ester carboxylesterase
MTLPTVRAHRLAEQPQARRWLITELWADEAVGIVGGEREPSNSATATPSKSALTLTDRRPPMSELVQVTRGLSRRELLQHDANAPMLVINGADDYFVPQTDTTVFADRRDTQVRLLEHCGHCATARMPEVLAMATEWLHERLA